MDEAVRNEDCIMDLQALKVKTVFKLKTLNLESNVCDKICDRVMRGNTKGVRKIIHTYIRQNTERKSNIFFYNQFIKKSSKRFLNKLNTEQIKTIVFAELDSLLRHEFKRNKRNLRFQRIVNRAIECTQQCVDERVHKDIPQLVKERYKFIVKGGKQKIIVDAESEFNKLLVEKRIETTKIAQDVFELVNELDFYQHCKKQLALQKKLPKIPTTGLIDAFDLALYYQSHWEESRDWQKDADKCRKRIDFILDNSDIPRSIKVEVRESGYEVKSKKNRLFIKRVKKQFESFMVYEKYGNISDTFYKKNKGAIKIVRQPNLVLEHMEENPSINLDEFLFNTMILEKSDFMKRYQMLLNHRHVKIIKSGKWKTITKKSGKKIEYYYIIYDYIAQKEWFDAVDWNKLLERCDIPSIDDEFLEECCIDYMLPYISRSFIQMRFTTNFRIFCNKVGLNGMSERIDDVWVNENGEIEATKAIINPYQIYYPNSKYIDKRMSISKEAKRRQYYALYSSFFHKIKYTEKGELSRGGNIIREPQFTTGDNNLDLFIDEIDKRSFYLEGYVEKQNELIKRRSFESFFKDVLKFFGESFHKNNLFKFLNTSKHQQIMNLGREMRKYRKYYEIVDERKGLHGNSRQAKRLDGLIKKFILPIQKISEIRKSIEMYRGLKKELKTGVVEKHIQNFKKLMLEGADRYVEVKYYRRILTHRNKLSLARTMTHNLHIKGVVRTYKTKNRGFIHKFTHEYRDDEIPLEYGVVKTKNILNLLLRMSFALRDKEIFRDIYQFLLDKDLIYKEKKLLEDFKGN